MKIDNPFDKKLEATKRMPASLRAALVDITDTLDFAWASAQTVFEKKATPEHAIMLLPLILARADAERQRTLDEIAARTKDAPKRSAKRPGAPPADR